VNRVFATFVQSTRNVHTVSRLFHTDATISGAPATGASLRLAGSKLKKLELVVTCCTDSAAVPSVSRLIAYTPAPV
jgi:hypothetical protein